jgi:hypothetical protein
MPALAPPLTQSSSRTSGICQERAGVGEGSETLGVGVLATGVAVGFGVAVSAASVDVGPAVGLAVRQATSPLNNTRVPKNLITRFNILTFLCAE